MNWGELARRLREEAQGWTQKDLASAVGLKQPTVSQYLKGTKRPSLESLSAFARALDTSLDYLTGLREEADDMAHVAEPTADYAAADYLTVPLLKDRAAAGFPRAVESSTVITRLPFTRYWLRKRLGALPREGRLVLIRVDKGWLGESPSNRTLNAYTALLHAALAYAASPEVGLIAANPMAGFRRLEETRREPPALSVEQVAALFEALEDWRGWVAALRVNPTNTPRVPLATRLYLGYYTGGRPEAIDRLRWRDVDLGAGVTRYRSKGHDVVCPLDPRLVAHLQAVKKIATRADGLILASPDTGKPVVTWRVQWARLVRFANVRLEAARREPIPPGTPLHVLRHSRITHLLQAGMEAQAVAQSTGTSLVMLDRHYAHLMAGALGRALTRARKHSSQRMIDAAAGGQKAPAAGQKAGQNEGRKGGKTAPRSAATRLN